MGLEEFIESMRFEAYTTALRVDVISVEALRGFMRGKALYSINDALKKPFLRFMETCDDGEGYDVPPHVMLDLAAEGLIRRSGTTSFYEITVFGLQVFKALQPASTTGAKQ